MRRVLRRRHSKYNRDRLTPCNDTVRNAENYKVRTVMVNIIAKLEYSSKSAQDNAVIIYNFISIPHHMIIGSCFIQCLE